MKRAIAVFGFALLAFVATILFTSCSSVSQQDVHAVITTVAQDVLPQLSIAFAANPQWTADERRDFARGVVKTEIAAKWPDYAFLLDTIVEIVIAQKK